MHEYKIYKKLKRILDYIDKELNKTPSEHDKTNYYKRIWLKGYRQAMLLIKDLIWETLNEND